MTEGVLKLAGAYHDLLAKLGAGSAHPGGFAVTMELVAGLKLNENAKVLDVGCGTGRSACYISQTFGCQVTGLDLHPLMIEKAKQRAENSGCRVNFVEGNALSTPFQDNEFDVILAESVAVFLPIQRFLSECRRIVAPGGTMANLEFFASADTSPNVLEAVSSVYGVRRLPTLKGWIEHYKFCGFRELKLWKPQRVDFERFMVNERRYPDEKQTVSEEIYEDWKLLPIMMNNASFMQQYNKCLGFTGFVAKK